MNIEQFMQANSRNQFYEGQRLWFFGAKYDAKWKTPGVHIPFTEGEIEKFGYNQFPIIRYISPKTGRPLQKSLSWGHNYSVKGGFNTGNEIQIFDNKEEAEFVYTDYVQQKAREIEEIVNQKTAQLYKWLDDLRAPLN